MRTKDFEHRLLMCEEFSEGSEIGDAVSALVSAASILYGISDYHNAQLALLAAENICENYISLVISGSDYEEYVAYSDKLFEHFMGMKKCSKEEYWQFISE